MLKKIPGTTLDFVQGAQKDPFAVIEPTINITGGLTLAQVVEITGLNASTIQNWVKRGWVSNPKGKRYGEQQIVRIILINMLRGAMQLEDAIMLMQCINGEVDDRSDDIIPDRKLYAFLCEVIMNVPMGEFADIGKIEKLVEVEVSEYTEPYTGAKDKLSLALTVMALAYQAAIIKNIVADKFAKLKILQGE